MRPPGGRLRHAGRYLRYGVELVRGAPVHLARGRGARAPLRRRLWEQARLLFTRDMTADDYYLYGLDRPTLSWTAKREFVGSRFRLRWQAALNPPHYRFFTDDKLVFKRFLTALGVPTPPLLGLIGPAGRAETGEPLRSRADLERWLTSGGIEHFVLKPVDGSRSAGILLVGRRLPGPEPRWATVPAGDAVGPAEIWAHIEARPHIAHFLVERRVWPHPALADLGGEVVHSARILSTLRGQPAVVLAVLRINRGRGPSDSFGRGNLAAPIDVATGRLSGAVVKGSHERLAVHPDTGVPIEGRTLPDWPATVRMVCDAAARIPFDTCLGWDVALTPDGPVVLEANDRFGINVLQGALDRGILGTPLRAHLACLGALPLIGLPGDAA